MKLASTLLGAGSALALLVGLSTAAMAQTKIGVVVKVGGIPWFNAMEMGIEEKGEELGVEAFMVGPTSPPTLRCRCAPWRT